MGRHWAPSPDPLNSQNYLPLCAGYEEKNAELVRKVDGSGAEAAWQIQEPQRKKDHLPAAEALFNIQHHRLRPCQRGNDKIVKLWDDQSETQE